MKIKMVPLLNIIIDVDDNCFGAHVKEIPTVFSSGDTLEELKANIKEALVLHYEAFDKTFDPEEAKFIYKFDVPELEEIGRTLKLTHLSLKSKVNYSALEKYTKGKQYPSKEDLKRIEKAIHEIGNDLLNIKLTNEK